MTMTKSKRAIPAALAAGMLLTATLAFGVVSASARAEDHRGHDRGHEWHHEGGWRGNYYRAPPIVYGAPYYAAPPVVYGPGFGINLNIR